MRTASFLLFLLFQSTTWAGFSVTGWYADSSRASLESVETGTSLVPAAESRGLEENVRGTYAKLSQHYSDIIGGAVSTLETQIRGIRLGAPASMGELHFLITAPRTKECFDPTRLRLDISFDINGIDMGGLSSISGAPLGNGHKGIVRIEGMDGMLLVEDFEPEPYIALQTGEASSRDAPAITFVQELLCLIFVAAAFLSTLLNSQQMDQQRLRYRARAVTNHRRLAKAS